MLLSRRVMACAVVAMCVATSTLICVSAARIHPNVHRELQQQPQQRVTIVIDFKDTNRNRVLEEIDDDDSMDRGERISQMIDRLKRHNKDIQQEVLSQHADVLKDVEVHELWITPSLYVSNASPEVVGLMSKLDSVKEIRLPVVTSVDLPSVGSTMTQETTSHSMPTRRLVSGPKWGIEQIQAPQVWQAGITGQNVIVANLDSGVRWTHEALRDSFVGLDEYGWYDPWTKAAEPYDPVGHGTHTMGTLVGQKGIGVAPGAKWMACKTDHDGVIRELMELKCAQFVTCPHDTQGNNANCSKAPHVVSNSWNFLKKRRSFADSINVWRHAGIIPVFSSGNEGPSCSTVSSPGNYAGVITVGATAANDSIAMFSSRGPTRVNGIIKPDISAPGYLVWSAVSTDDKSYAYAFGTSMATPHVAGVIALMLSHDRSLKYDQILQKLVAGADTKTLVNTNSGCGGISEDVFPNHVYGYGRVNAFRAVFGKPVPRGLCFTITTKFWCTVMIPCRWTASGFCESRF